MHLGSHVPRLAELPCKEIVVSSILIGSTIGLSKNHEVIAATMRTDSRGKQEVRFAGWMYADGVMVSIPLVNSGGRVRIPLYSESLTMAEWRNWYTRQSQKLLGATPCGFDSHLGYESRQRGSGS